MIIRKHFIYIILLSILACNPRGSEETHDVSDSSLLGVQDSTTVSTIDTALINQDTITYEANQLVGTWMQPVQGLEKEKQGFQLQKDGKMKSVNTYTLVYERWQLMHDTLLLWNHSEGTNDTTHLIDTTIIRALTDSTLTLYPTKAAEGYLEQYVKEKEKHKKGKQ